MTFKEMGEWEPGLFVLEQRMKAVYYLIQGLQTSDPADLEQIVGLPLFADITPMCFSSLEARFGSSLLLLVGPNGMHPKLKDAECYSEAHRFLWRYVPKCSHRGLCSESMHEPA